MAKFVELVEMTVCKYTAITRYNLTGSERFRPIEPLGNRARIGTERAWIVIIAVIS